MQSESSREPEINKLFRMVKKHEASDLYLKVGQPPMIRLCGDLRRMEIRPLTQEDLKRLLDPIMDVEQHLQDGGAVAFGHIVGKEECRFVCKVSKKDGQLSLSARRTE